MAAIELEGVHKTFGNVVALDGLDLTVQSGEIFGFLGPNGAGKSTTINIILDFVRADRGTITVLGQDAHKNSQAIRQRTGVLPEGFGVYDRLTAREHVSFAIDSKNADSDPDQLLERVGLSDDSDRKAGGFSTGMKQRLSLAMALVGNPELLILDEPSTGLDPIGAREFQEIVRAEASNGTTVFFSSHILGQVEAVCDRVGILRDGEIVAVDSIEGLREAVGSGSKLRIEVDTVPKDIDTVLQAVDGVQTVDVTSSTITVSCDDSVKTQVVSTIESEGATVTDFATEEQSLDELFSHYAGEGS